MPDGFYRWHVGTLRDGRITTQIPVVSTSWQDVMDDAGPLSATMVLTDPAVAALRPYLIAEPCRCFLAVAYTDAAGTETFLAGGPIWTHNYDGNSKQVTIGASGLWSYYDHRKVLPVLAAGVNPATVTTNITNSLGTIAKRLVQLAHTHTAGTVPVLLPADEAGTDSRAYAGYEMNAVGGALRDLTTTDSGPEIQFVPRRRADDPRYIEWLMRVGTIAQPLLYQDGDDWVWDATVPRSSVSSISVTRDGSAMGTRQWGQGAGTESTTLFAEVDSTDLFTAGFPLLENVDTTHSTETNQSRLNAATRGAAQKGNRPVETWSVKVRRDDVPTVGSYAVGDWVSLKVANDPYLPDGTYRTRITSKAGDDALDITLGLAPTRGGI